jgi:type II secretory pathway pseudopilin PulG
MSPSPRRAFTLVELLVVLCIVTLLTGLLMPMVGLAKRSSMRTVSKAIMGKVEAALRQFKADYKGYPYQLAYADEGQPWTNALNYNIGTDIIQHDQDAVKADMAAAAGNYVFSSSNNWNRTSVHTFVPNRQNGQSSNDPWNSPESDVAPNYAYQPVVNGAWYWNYSPITPACVMLNRLAAERANELMLVGAINTGGVVMQDIQSGPTRGNLTHHGRDLSATPLVASPASQQHPGWAKDYLQGEIDAKYIRGDAILDAWFHPLIYICQVQPGCEYAFGQIQNQAVDIGNPAVYGLAPRGRRALQPFYPGTSTPIVGDPQTLPDTTQLMHSDMRAWSAPGYELEFELWSAGPDGRMSWWRDDLANRDNIPCGDYNRGIGAMP